MARLKLDNSAYSRNWKHSTENLKKHFTKKLESIQERADVKRKEADEIEKEKQVIEETLDELNKILPEPKQPVLGPNGKWSLDYDACTRCRRNTVKHMAAGLCATCYSKRNSVVTYVSS